ncbi:hypothetical protein [Pseudonocardia parietis]|uniref:DUF222 domain-containing protein n=1 Tax=Pseudonocardia parietis TaxID=570936 RepID=A0ABS4W1Y7_9PSEU|nr:hypothetical protein [Pseudonocardia parietis]MBP2370222.1 hypothetical protein [Pseudonocardia parietis]
MDFGPESDAALREFADADATLADAKLRNLADRGGLERRVEAARAALAPFYERLVVRALPPDEMDALVAAHPPTDEDKAKAKERGGDAAWNPATFAPALLGACVHPEDPDDAPLSEQEWAELTSKGPVSSGELRYLLQTALDINDRSPDPNLGKG